MNWKTAAEIRKNWGGQFCLKGIMSAEDAKAWGLIDEILENRGKAEDTSK